MVSIEDRSNYLSGIQGNLWLNGFRSLLNCEPPSLNDSSELNEIDGIYFEAIAGIAQNSWEGFDKAYKIISKRQPSRNSNAPFVHNDYLIFVLIVGIFKFNFEQAWIRKIINIRSANQITSSFENILNSDFFAKSNAYEIIYCFLLLVDPEKITKEFQDDSYDRITANRSLFEDRNDFLILCSLKAYDKVIKSRQILDTTELDKLTVFETKFLKMCGILSYIVYNIVLLLIFYGIWKLLNHSTEIKNTVSDFGLVFTILGMGIANFLKTIPNILKKRIAHLFGYSKEIDD